MANKNWHTKQQRNTEIAPSIYFTWIRTSGTLFKWLYMNGSISIFDCFFVCQHSREREYCRYAEDFTICSSSCKLCVVLSTVNICTISSPSHVVRPSMRCWAHLCLYGLGPPTEVGPRHVWFVLLLSLLQNALMESSPHRVCLAVTSPGQCDGESTDIYFILQKLIFSHGDVLLLKPGSFWCLFWIIRIIVKICLILLNGWMGPPRPVPPVLLGAFGSRQMREKFLKGPFFALFSGQSNPPPGVPPAMDVWVLAVPPARGLEEKPGWKAKSNHIISSFS